MDDDQISREQNSKPPRNVKTLKHFARVTISIWLVGFALLEFSALHSAYRIGAFGHVDSVSSLISGLALSVAMNALWPVILVLFLIHGPPN